MKAEWFVINREKTEKVGLITIEGKWADASFRQNVLNLFSLLSKEENLVPEWEYDSSIETVKMEEK